MSKKMARARRSRQSIAQKNPDRILNSARALSFKDVGHFKSGLHQSVCRLTFYACTNHPPGHPSAVHLRLEYWRSAALRDNFACKSQVPQAPFRGEAA